MIGLYILKNALFYKTPLEKIETMTRSNLAFIEGSDQLYYG